MIHLRLLGPIELVRDDGTSVQSVLTQPKRVALLAYLCLANPGGFIRRDTLLAMFWPESDEAHARRSLNQAIYFLRRSLGEDVIVSRGDEEVGIDAARLRVDVLELAAAASQERWEEAVALYRGPLMGGFHAETSVQFEHWLDGQRRSLETLVERRAGASGVAHDAAAVGRARSGAGRRLRSAAVGGVIAVVAVLVLALTVPREPPVSETDRASAPTSRPLRLAVLPLLDLSEPSERDDGAVGRYASEWLTQQIAVLRILDVVPGQAVRAAWATGDSAQHFHGIAERLDLDLIVGGWYRRSGGSVTFSLDVNRARTDLVAATVGTVEVDTSALNMAIGELTDRLLGALMIQAPSVRLPHIGGTRPPRYATWLTLERGMREYNKGRWRQAIDIWTAERQDSLWPHLRFYIAVAHVALNDFGAADSVARVAMADTARRSPYDELALWWLASLLKGDMLAKEKASSQLARMNPGAWRPQAAYDVLEAGRYDSALVLLAQLDSSRQWFVHWARVTTARHALGRHQEELAAASYARVLHPDQPRLLHLEATAAGALCDTARVHAIVEESLEHTRPYDVYHIAADAARELRAHGCRELADPVIAAALRLYDAGTVPGSMNDVFALLLMAGRFEDLHRRASARPTAGALQEFEAIGWTGIAAAATGRVQDARAAAATLRSLSEEDALNARRYRQYEAAVHAWLGEKDHALRLMRRGVREGIRNAAFIHSDPRLEPLFGMRGFPPPPAAFLRASP